MPLNWFMEMVLVKHLRRDEGIAWTWKNLLSALEVIAAVEKFRCANILQLLDGILQLEQCNGASIIVLSQQSNKTFWALVSLSSTIRKMWVSENWIFSDKMNGENKQTNEVNEPLVLIRPLINSVDAFLCN